MDYLRPATLEDALAALTSPGARALAGGSDLLVRCGRDEPWPEHLVDLKGLAELRGIEEIDGILRIGALATVAELLESRVLEAWPALEQACLRFAGRQIRNRATLGGNLANASPAADSIAPLMIHEAVCVSDRRRIPIAEFFLGPGRTVLEAGELLLQIEIPREPEGTRSFYVKLAPREAMAISVVGVAGLLILREGKVALARLALASVAPTVIRARRAETFLEGGILDKDRIREAARLAAEASHPIDDIRASAAYRRRMVERLTAWELSRLG